MVTISINDNIKLINKNNNFEQISFDIILLSVCIIFCFFEEYACSSSESFNIFITSIKFECCLLCSLLSVFSVFSKTIGDDGEYNE